MRLFLIIAKLVSHGMAKMLKGILSRVEFTYIGLQELPNVVTGNSLN
jgi:hypothetical protein